MIPTSLLEAIPDEMEGTVGTQAGELLGIAGEASVPEAQIASGKACEGIFYWLHSRSNRRP